MRRTHRRLLLVPAAVAAALVLAGCVRLTSFDASQPTPFGSVQIVSQICRSGSPGCADGGGNSTLTPAAGSNVDSQVLIGYRVTAGSTPPATLGLDAFPLQFVPSASYTSELQRLAPAPAGQQWFGYISSQFTSTPAATAATITTRFGLPASADGTPFSSTYGYLVVVGAREADAQNDPNRPVSCGASLFAISDGSICIDSPAPSDVTSFKTLGGIRDVGVAGRTSAPVQAGGTAAVPFTLRANAIPPNTAADLAASTAAPSGSATVTPAAVALAPNAGTEVTVRVRVADGTPPGDYPVTLTVSVGTDVRSGQGIVRVARPGAGGGGGGGGGGAAGLPSISARVAPKSIKRTRTAPPAVVTATLSDAGTVRMAVSRAADGRRRARACVAPTRALIRGGARRCTRFVAVTAITKAGLGAGRRTIAFSGRGRAAGTYRLSLTLRAGGLVSRPAVVTVTVKP